MCYQINNEIFKLHELVLDAMADAGKFDRGNNTAGIRVRKAMQDIRSQAEFIRKEIQRQKRRRKSCKKK
jgi:hypothetical protein